MDLPTNQCGVFTFAQNGICTHSLSKIEPGETKITLCLGIWSRLLLMVLT